MYDEVLMERSLHPEFFGRIPEVKPVKLKNASCGDELEVYLKVKDGVIVDGRFNGVGCAISKASADLFIAAIRGKKISEARGLEKLFSQMVLGEKDDFKKLGPAEAMAVVSRMPARANCARLAWKSLEKIGKQGL